MENMSAVNGHQLGMLTTKTLEGMRTEENFKLFYESVNQESQSENINFLKFNQFNLPA